MSGEAPESGTGPPPTDPPAAAQVPSASIHVFISYASQDAAVAGALVEALERHGVGCWIAPRDVKAGAQYADAIVRAISGAKAIVLVLSESAIASSHVGREIERASSKKRPIIALRIDAAPLTPALEYFLSESQWVEAQTGSMEAAYAKLIDDIRDPAQTAPRHIPAAPLGVSAAPARAEHPKLRFNWILYAAGTVFVVALAAVMVDKLWISSHVAQEKPIATTSLAPAAAVPAQPTISEKSIAVLPFVDMSEKKDQEYFSDGLSEELIDMLTKIPNLRVPARTSSFYFKGKSEDVATIARKLRVAHVLEGSVRKAGDRLRVTAQLIRADNGYHLWSQTYDRNLKDVFQLQDEIAGAVVGALKVRLLPSQQPSSSHRTESTEAYDQYLLGRQFAERETADDRRRAGQAFRKAIELDPGFSAAYAWLSIYEYLEADDTAGYARAMASAEKAVTLAPQETEGYTARAFLRLWITWDWSGAMADAEKALALDPGAINVQWAFGDLMDDLGRFPEAIAASRKATELDPLSFLSWMRLAGYLIDDRQFAAANNAMERALEISPESTWGRDDLGQLQLLEGKASEAAATFAKFRGVRVWGLTGVSMAEHSLGHARESQQALDELIAKHAQGAAYQVAEVYAWRGDRGKAFEWLERAYRQRDTELVHVKADPILASLHGDPRFGAFLRKMKLPE